MEGHAAIVIEKFEFFVKKTSGFFQNPEVSDYFALPWFATAAAAFATASALPR
jgi:hypothetical protein